MAIILVKGEGAACRVVVRVKKRKEKEEKRKPFKYKNRMLEGTYTLWIA